MFEIHDRAFAPMGDAYESALRAAPRAHHEAADAAVAHLHEHAVRTADRVKLDSRPIVISRSRGVPFIGIAVGPEGDKVFEREYGTFKRAPQAILRQALAKHRGEAQQVYEAVVSRSLGIQI